MKNISIESKYVTYAHKMGSQGVAPYKRVSETCSNSTVRKIWKKQQKARKVEQTVSPAGQIKLVKKGSTNWIKNLYSQGV